MDDLNSIKMCNETNLPDCSDLFKRLKKSKKLPKIKNSLDVMKKIDLTYDYIVESQPIGRQLFNEFCEKNNSYYDCLNLFHFIQESKCLIDDFELEATFIVVKNKLIQFYESRQLESLIGCKKLFRKLTAMENKKLTKKFLNPCELKIRHFLSIKVFKEFLSSIYFYRYLQWKKLEQMKIDEKQFEFYSVIGTGGFCKVFSCKDKLTKKIYACKVYNMKSLRELDVREPLALSEKKILEKLNSEFIVSLIYSFVSETSLCMILPIFIGGSLDYHIQHRNKEPGLDYNSVQFYAAEIICGIEYLHKKNIVHLDIKPDNILLTETGHIRITDFGLALELDKNSSVAYPVGTIGYMAPEVVRCESFRFSPDWFSFGCLFYEMIDGKNPFADFRKNPNVDLIEHRVLHKCEKYSPKFNGAARDLCESLLKKNPQDRIGYFLDNQAAKQIKNEDFFKSISWNQIKCGFFKPPYIPDDESAFDAFQPKVSVEEKITKSEIEIKFCEQFNTGINSIPWQNEVLHSELFSRVNKFTPTDSIHRENELRLDSLPVPSTSRGTFNYDSESLEEKLDLSVESDN